MAAERWDPFREAVSLRDAMNTLLQESFVRPIGTIAAGLQGGNLPLDMVETDNEFVLWASLPGIKPESVDITVQGETVSIRAEGPPEHEEKRGQNWLLRERRKGALHRSVIVPAAIDTDRARAQFDNGVLTLTLPKAGTARPHQIKVNAGSSAPTPPPTGP